MELFLSTPAGQRSAWGVGVAIGISVKDGVAVKVTVGGKVTVTCGAADPQAVSRNKSRKIKMVRMGFLYYWVK